MGRNIKNDKSEFLLNMKNRQYPVPSFLSIKFDSELKIYNLTFSRVFRSKKGTIDVVKKDDSYIWSADNFPLNQLELSLSKNQFDRINGIINGSGFIALDQSHLGGEIALSSGKYRNINLENSLFDFNFKDNSFYVNSSLYPIDGGIIGIEYNSNKNNLINLNFNNISTSWTITTAVDIFNFDNQKFIPISKSNVLDDLEINNINKSLKQSIEFLNDLIKKNNAVEEKFNLQKYLSKFKSRYDAKLTIKGDSPPNYKLNAKLNGYLDVSRMLIKIKKRNFPLILKEDF